MSLFRVPEFLLWRRASPSLLTKPPRPSSRDSAVYEVSCFWRSPEKRSARRLPQRSRFLIFFQSLIPETA